MAFNDHKKGLKSVHQKMVYFLIWIDLYYLLISNMIFKC